MSEYERELIAKKLEKSKIGSDSSEKESDMVIVGSEDASPVEKGSDIPLIYQTRGIDDGGNCFYAHQTEEVCWLPGWVLFFYVGVTSET